LTRWLVAVRLTFKDPRVELIDGYLVRKMTKKPKHTTITEWLRDRLAETLPPGWHVRKEEPVRIPNFDEPEPDLTVTRGGIKDYGNRHPVPADIALIVEVADACLDRDRGEKLSAYARGECPPEPVKSWS
jgi:Uma2 family endonuclease